jgi:DNA-binding transcriptional ArsR family regulator
MSALPITTDDRTIWDIWLARYQFPAMTAADEVGTFAALSANALTTGELASQLAVDARALGIHLGLLAAIGLVERRDGRWRLSGFDGIYRRDELVPVVPGQSLHVDAAALAPFRTSYRFLSYVLSRNGYDVNGELPGEDRPEQVAALEEELFRWAGI